MVPLDWQVPDPGKDPGVQEDIPTDMKPHPDPTPEMPDTGKDDSGTDDSTVPPIEVNPGDVIFTEILLNPPGASDTELEAVELFNTTDQPIDINGWSLSDKDKDHHLIDAGGPLVVPPKGHLVLSRSADWVGAGVSSYDYSGFVLSNSEDEAVLSAPDGEMIDEVVYVTGTGFPKTDGAALQLDPAHYDHKANDHGDNWCPSTTAQVAPIVDDLLATLGAANHECNACAGGCLDRECGCDACGNPCGGCALGFGCTDAGKCVEVGDECIPKDEQDGGCPGCDCEACVCALDNWCCDVAWDIYCVELCETQCGGPACSDTCLSMDCFFFDRECGPDGCCGSCGSCGSGSFCKEPEGKCQVCTCDAKECGDDGCGKTCGSCTGSLLCHENACVDPGCVPTEVPGCGGCACEDCVCAIDGFCCSNLWDSICVQMCSQDCGQSC